jgi:surface protein
MTLFYDANNFNGDIGGWDTSNVTDMRSMSKLESTRMGINYFISRGSYVWHIV